MADFGKEKNPRNKQKKDSRFWERTIGNGFSPSTFDRNGKR